VSRRELRNTAVSSVSFLVRSERNTLSLEVAINVATFIGIGRFEPAAGLLATFAVLADRHTVTTSDHGEKQATVLTLRICLLHVTFSFVLFCFASLLYLLTFDLCRHDGSSQEPRYAAQRRRARRSLSGNTASAVRSEPLLLA